MELQRTTTNLLIELCRYYEENKVSRFAGEKPGWVEKIRTQKVKPKKVNVAKLKDAAKANLSDVEYARWQRNKEAREIVWAMEAKGFVMSTQSKELGKNPQYINQLKQGNTSASAEVLEKLKRLFNTDDEEMKILKELRQAKDEIATLKKKIAYLMEENLELKMKL